MPIKFNNQSNISVLICFLEFVGNDRKPKYVNSLSQNTALMVWVFSFLRRTSYPNITSNQYNCQIMSLLLFTFT